MSALPRFVLRPLVFPSHRYAALVCLRTGRVVALRLLASLPLAEASPCASAWDAAASRDTAAAMLCPARGVGGPEPVPSPWLVVSAGGNAPAARACLATLTA